MMSWFVIVSLILMCCAADASSKQYLQGDGKTNHGYQNSTLWLARVPVITSLTGQQLLAGTALPSAFDWRSVDGRSYVTPDLNQHIPIYCGACWIHGAVHALNDRIKVLRKGQYPDVLVSRQALMNCVPDPEGVGPPPGCNGGDVWMVHKYMHSNKVPDDSCLPYTAQNMGCSAVNLCRNCAGKINPATGLMEPDYCYAVENWAGYGVGDYGNVSGEIAMIKEIYARGPISCSVATDDVFMYNYTTNKGVLAEGVYTTDKKFTPDDIDHVMEITGWGETPSGTKYWVVRNSWGTYWGDMGWVKIQRGVNLMMIESSCDWSVPNFEDLDVQLKSRVLGDYIHGTTNAGLRLGVSTGGTAAVKAFEVSNTSTMPMSLVACAGAILGALVNCACFVVVGKLQKRKFVIQHDLLG